MVTGRQVEEEDHDLHSLVVPISGILNWLKLWEDECRCKPKSGTIKGFSTLREAVFLYNCRQGFEVGHNEESIQCLCPLSPLVDFPNALHRSHSPWLLFPGSGYISKAWSTTSVSVIPWTQGSSACIAIKYSASKDFATISGSAQPDSHQQRI